MGPVEKRAWSAGSLDSGAAKACTARQKGVDREQAGDRFGQRVFGREPPSAAAPGSASRRRRLQEPEPENRHRNQNTVKGRWRDRVPGCGNTQSHAERQADAHHQDEGESGQQKWPEKRRSSSWLGAAGAERIPGSPLRPPRYFINCTGNWSRPMRRHGLMFSVRRTPGRDHAGSPGGTRVTTHQARPGWWGSCRSGV
jgi:hypothetical protein